jgi:hypothetical protein
MELGLLVAFMIATIALMVGMMVVFRRWMRRRDHIDPTHRPSGH